MQPSLFVFSAMLLFAGAALAEAPAPQSPCVGSRLSGFVRDTTSAVIPGATVTLDGVTAVTADETGRYLYSCVASGDHVLHTTAEAFAPTDSVLRIAPEAKDQTLNISLRIEEVETSVDAVVDDPLASDTASGSRTIKQGDLMQLADDPDDLARELQVIAAAGGGGIPGSATISVDGFQDSAHIPPKGSIAFIRINPDLFSAEFGNPSYPNGGRIEIYTKPAVGRVHGSVFLTSSNSFLNARDPFALSRAAIGKKRYGFDLSFPIKPNRADLSLNLEKRDIDNFGVVNTFTLDSALNPVKTIYNVPTPEHLWIASARSGLQLSKNNLATISYSAYVTHAENVGAGGTTLQEASYNGQQGEHAIRATLISTLTPRLVHEGRFGITFNTIDNTPVSTAPAINVSGAFTGGGSALGNSFTHEKRMEINDDVLYTLGKHSIKAGIIAMIFNEHYNTPSNFNGVFNFSACLLGPQSNCTPSSEAPDGLTQYKNALLGTGTATGYTITTGSPRVDLTQVRTGLYVQDQWKLNDHIQISLGLRESFQIDPTSWFSLQPRFGIAWSPGKKQNLVIRGRVGLFASQLRTDAPAQVIRLNGTRQVPATYYNASFTTPTAQPAGNIIGSRYSFAPHLMQQPSFQSHLGIEYTLPHKWQVQGNGYLFRYWDSVRTVNINSPLNGSPTGPRPIAPNVNLFQYQQSGLTTGNVTYFGVNQSSLKRLQVNVMYLRLDFRTTATDANSQPQSAYSDAGERSRPDWQNTHILFIGGNLNLPYKISLSSQFNTQSGKANNLITGIDNNGDGVYNDRPFYATGSTPSENVVVTPYGRLTASGSGVSVPRNTASLPWTIYLDSNIARTFVLNGKAKKEQQQTFSVNIRAANLLNHTNVTAVGNVLGSPLFGRAYSSDSGRRVEFGLRYSF